MNFDFCDSILITDALLVKLFTCANKETCQTIKDCSFIRKSTLEIVIFLSISYEEMKHIPVS